MSSKKLKLACKSLSDVYPSKPLAKAPLNVFEYADESGRVRGWKNIFQLPIEYDVELVDGILSPENPVLASKNAAEGVEPRRFIVVDDAVERLYGKQIKKYFEERGVQTHTVVLQGEEQSKRMEAVDKVLEELCIFGLQRREAVVAIGGGVILDIVGLAASLYRRGVPYIRVPTTLLAIVDASVGVKTGVDYCSCVKGPLKNRVGSFFAPAGALLDKSFINTQDRRNLVNGLGEIMKLGLACTPEIFQLLDKHGPRLVNEKFQGTDGIADRVIELSVKSMMEELGPNLWEHKLERCVDYGHTFSKIIEMQPVPYVMHGEAVNIDGLFSCVLSHRRGHMSTPDLHRIYRAMRRIGLPTITKFATDLDVMDQALRDAAEHRHGKQRIPLVVKLGSCVYANDITRAEVRAGILALIELHEEMGDRKLLVENEATRVVEKEPAAAEEARPQGVSASISTASLAELSTEIRADMKHSISVQSFSSQMSTSSTSSPRPHESSESGTDTTANSPKSSPSSRKRKGSPMSLTNPISSGDDTE